MHTQKTLPSQFERPKVVVVSSEDIARRRRTYHQVVASFALEGEAPSEFGCVVAMEEIRGELTEDQVIRIINGDEPEESQRINEKITQLHALGLTWKDL